MFRDVLPEMMQLKVIFMKPNEILASKVLKMRNKNECSVKFWDLREKNFVTRQMFPVADETNALLLDNQKFTCDDIEIRFTQTQGVD